MKRLLCLALAVVLSFGLALGEAAPKLDNTGFLQCDCNSEFCTCFVQLGDCGAVIDLVTPVLVEGGYLDEAHMRQSFDLWYWAAVKAFQEDNGIMASGMLDDETLYYMLGGASEEQLAFINKFKYSMCFYIPTDIGDCVHTSPQCSNMLNPRKVSANTAAILVSCDPARVCGKCCRENKEK